MWDKTFVSTLLSISCKIIINRFYYSLYFRCPSLKDGRALCYYYICGWLFRSVCEDLPARQQPKDCQEEGQPGFSFLCMQSVCLVMNWQMVLKLLNLTLFFSLLNFPDFSLLHQPCRFSNCPFLWRKWDLAFLFLIRISRSN